MEMPPIISPAKRQHSQISAPSSSSSTSSPLSTSSTCNSIDDNNHETGKLQPPQHQHNPLESLMQFFGSTFRSSSLQPSKQKQQQQQPQPQQQTTNQQYRPPVQSVALRPSVRTSSDARVYSNSINVKQQVAQQQTVVSRPGTMTEYDAMLAGSYHNGRLTSTESSSESLVKSSATHTTATASSSTSTSTHSSAVTFSESATSSAWRVALCPRTNQLYYWNVETRESRWKKPLELASAEEVESIRNKERKQREFFECMERNILRRLEQGGDGGYSSNVVTGSTSNCGGGTTAANSKRIDQCWMHTTSAAAADSVESSTTPTANNEGNSSNMNDWIAGWITPNSETDGSGSPSGSLSSIQTLSEFGSFDKCSSGNNNNHTNGHSPVSLDYSLEWSHVGSMESESREEEHDDQVRLLPAPAKPSKLERIKSSSSKPMIDKPSLIRTISKMEHDMFVARQLNPNLRIKVNKPNSSTDNERYDSPRTVSGSEETKKKLKRRSDIMHEPLSPTTQTCDILSSLHLTQDGEGLNISLDTSFDSAFSVPTSPLTPNDSDDDDAATPSQVRSLGSPGGGNSTPAAVSESNAVVNTTLTKPTLTKRNTCGTIYLGSTLSAPDKEALIKCVCGVFRAHLLQAKPSHADSHVYDVFRDRRSIGDYRLLDTTSIPTLSTITDYFRSIFLRSQMEVECIIVTLIYIERVIKLTDGKLAPTSANWRSVLFSCMVLASKVWDDLSMWNCDFSKIVPSGVTFSLARTNELEIALLRALKYKVKVNASEYAKYYFLLRSMICRSGLANDDLTRLEALDVKGAANLLDAATGGGGASANSGSNGGGTRSSGVAKVLLKKRCKSHSVVERSSIAIPVGEDDGSCNSGSLSPQCNTASTTKVNLEQIVRMN